MDYPLGVHTPIWGDLIPLIRVANAMARHAARGYGHYDLHEPTLLSVRPTLISSILSDAKSGQIVVCNSSGKEALAAELIRELPWHDAANGECSEELEINSIFVKKHHLAEWAEANGHVFHFFEAPVEVVMRDLKDEHGNVIKKNYYRGLVGLPDPVSTSGGNNDGTGKLPPSAAAVQPEYTKRERQIKAIEAGIASLNYVANSIPTGGKAKLLEWCKEFHKDLFGAGDDPFLDAWKEARRQKRVRTENHDKYAGD